MLDEFFDFMGKPPFVLASLLLFIASLCRGVPPLSSTEKHQLEREARLVVDYVQNAHESGRLFRDLNNREILVSYMESLDGGHEYFLKDDTEFVLSRFGRSFRSVYLLKGDLQPAFEIFDLFEKRVQERTLWAEQRLARGFTFEDDEKTPATATDSATNSTEADRRWEIKLKAEVLALLLQGADEPEATATLAKRYAKIRRQVATMDSLAIRERFFDGLLQAFDPHSGYFSADSTREFHLEMSGAVAGAGLELKKENGLCIVADIKPGGPAELQTNLRPGDIIESFGDAGSPRTQTKGNRLRDIVAGIRGKAGTQLELTYRRPGDSASLTCTLERAVVVSIEDRARGFLCKVPVEGGKMCSIGVIDLPSFYADEDDTGKTSATQDVTELLNQMRSAGLDALVIDLRDNGGGALTEARALSGLFIPKGVIMLSRGLDGKIIEHTAIENAERYDGPLIVLTSEHSASASEIFSGAMKFHHRALIVGSAATFGKGSVQAYIELAKTRAATPADAAMWGTLRLTQERYYQPHGAAVQCDGISADIVLPQNKTEHSQREKDLPHALPAERVTAPADALPCPSITFPTTAALVERLRKMAEKNISQLPEWTLWKNEEKLINELSETKDLSLQLAKRQAQNETVEHSLATLRTQRRQLASSVDFAMTNIDIAAVQKALESHRGHLNQPSRPGESVAFGQLAHGGFLFKTDQDKPRLLWLDQFPYNRFFGDIEPLANAFSTETGVTLSSQQLRQILLAIGRLEEIDETNLLAAFAKQLPPKTEPSVIRKGVSAVLRTMIKIEGDLRSHHRALDIQLREALRIAAAWSAIANPSSSVP